MNDSGIYTLSEAGATKRWGSRQLLARAYADGKLKGREFNCPRKMILVTEQALEEFKASSKRLKDK